MVPTTPVAWNPLSLRPGYAAESTRQPHLVAGQQGGDEPSPVDPFSLRGRVGGGDDAGPGVSPARSRAGVVGVYAVGHGAVRQCGRHHGVPPFAHHRGLGLPFHLLHDVDNHPGPRHLVGSEDVAQGVEEVHLGFFYYFGAQVLVTEVDHVFREDPRILIHGYYPGLKRMFLIYFFFICFHTWAGWLTRLVYPNAAIACLTERARWVWSFRC